ncbi:CBS domain-containing protein [Allosalinactinospora lopnorensis]|uniref:CBS domain-containing protein n=1 Tax=Allosalinactinospora lopnorensis TaxID=1352348 RepID=UPI000623F1BB|nr:CBS domain-containing protein [Allosalinactinospora lopnorensis]
MSRIVREVMTTDVLSIGPESSVKEVARLMVARGVSALPVVEDDRVVGIVSETDLVRHGEFVSEGPEDEDDRVPLQTRLRRGLGAAGSVQDRTRTESAVGLMTRKVVTTGPEETVVAVARAMERHDLKQLPVVDERGRLMGMISRRDLLRVFVRPDEDIARDIGTALAAVPAWLDAGRIRFQVDDGAVTIEGRLEHRSHCAVITQLIHTVDGVVGLHSKLTWNVDDMLPPRTP